MDLGFGSPSGSGVYDLGFGSPSSLLGVLPLDTGFGSPTMGATFAVSGAGNLPDDGGEIVDLLGTWDDTEPYTVQLRTSGGATLYPSVAEGCFSARPGKGSTCRSVGGRKLSFASPECPPGVYDIKVSSPLGTSYALGALTVVYRARCGESDRIRRAFPATWATGAVIPQLGLGFVAANEAALRAEFPHGPLRALTHALGQEIQRINGRPETILVGNVDETDTTLTVESTLGFPDLGDLFIEGRRWHYTGRTATTFTGCAPLYLLGRGHPDGAYVAWVREVM